MADRTPNKDNIDDLLVDVKNLLDDGEAPQPQREQTLRQPAQEEQMKRESHIDEILRGAQASADRDATRLFIPVQPEDARRYAAQNNAHDDYDEDYDAPEPSILAYNSDFDERRRERTHARRHEEQAEARRSAAQRRARYDDDYEAPRRRSDAKRSARRDDYAPPRKKKRGHGCLTFLIVLLVLIGLGFGALRLFGSLAKKGDGRKSGVSTVLIAGTDDGGLRTDSIMLVTIDEKAKTYNVLSIPRDTLTNAPYNVPKINGAYGYYGCGEEGMNALIDLVEDCVGFRPDGYVLIDWNGFEELVDVMGGVDFEVPMDIELDGVELTAGMQHLDGRGALTVARFRAGYSLADLTRVEVQRRLIQAAMDQWVTLPNLLKVPSAISCVQKNTLTDLNVLNILWLARDLKVCTAGVNETLPGTAQMIGDGSYYVLDPQAVADLVNQSFNPYEKDITTDDLNIRQG